MMVDIKLEIEIIQRSDTREGKIEEQSSIGVPIIS
jgi:hypothetical protein